MKDKAIQLLQDAPTSDALYFLGNTDIRWTGAFTFSPDETNLVAQLEKRGANSPSEAEIQHYARAFGIKLL